MRASTLTTHYDPVSFYSFYINQVKFIERPVATMDTVITIKRQKRSQLLPSEVVTFENDGDGYAMVVPKIVSWRQRYEKWMEVGVVDNVKRKSSTGVEMLDFWYTTLRTGLLSKTDSADYKKTVLSIDDLGYAPAMFVNQMEGYITKTQTDRNINQMLKFYSHLQAYHTLVIDPESEYSYLQQRMHGHTTDIEDSVSALMQLLCYWSNTTAMSDVLMMNARWNIVFHQWMIEHGKGVDEALVRFAYFMLKDAQVDFEETRRICYCNSISTFVNSLFESSLEHRQFAIDALTDIFQNHTMGYMTGEVAYTESTDDVQPSIYYAPTTPFADKVPLYMNGHAWTLAVNQDNKVVLNKSLSPI